MDPNTIISPANLQQLTCPPAPRAGSVELPDLEDDEVKRQEITHAPAFSAQEGTSSSSELIYFDADTSAIMGTPEVAEDTESWAKDKLPEPDVRESKKRTRSIAFTASEGATGSGDLSSGAEKRVRTPRYG